jgi:carboxypeptidase C (cathepsin A)
LRANEYLNHRDVRKALHVNEHWATKNWTTCSGIVNYNRLDQFQDVTYLYQELVSMGQAQQHKLNMLIYSGDDDSVCGTAYTQSWIWGLGVNGKENHTWVPWTVDKQTAGYVTQFDLGASVHAKLTFATVHGAGHEVPAYRPKEALVMFQKYLSGEW